MESQATFYLDQLKPLVGGKITALARCGPNVDPNEDEFFGFVIKLPNGKTKTLTRARAGACASASSR